MVHGDQAYLHVSHPSPPRAATGGLVVVREGSAGAVLAIGATLDPLRSTV
ncbi:hypothetical protein [Streptomyces sp. AK02-04a]|nr:hypothetical protein [Streptomyces sp. AK02-04a]